MRPLVTATALLVATAAGSQPVARPPEQAAGQALMQCVAHTLGGGPIRSEFASQLAANGLVFSSVPPAALRSTAQTPYGKASYAMSPSMEGEVWAVGYDGPGTACLVFTLGTNVQPVEARVLELFGIPGTWKAEPATPTRPGERKHNFSWSVKTPKTRLSAIVSVNDLSTLPAKGMVMVTVAQSGKN